MKYKPTQSEECNFCFLTLLVGIYLSKPKRCREIGLYRDTLDFGYTSKNENDLKVYLSQLA